MNEDLKDLKWDMPDDAEGPQYRLTIEFDEDRGRFHVADHNLPEAERTLREVGDWREAALWMAKQLRILAMPVMYGDPTRPKMPSRATRTLTVDETLALLNHSDKDDEANWPDHFGE